MSDEMQVGKIEFGVTGTNDPSFWEDVVALRKAQAMSDVPAVTREKWVSQDEQIAALTAALAAATARADTAERERDAAVRAYLIGDDVHMSHATYSQMMRDKVDAEHAASEAISAAEQAQMDASRARALLARAIAANMDEDGTDGDDLRDEITALLAAGPVGDVVTSMQESEE